MKEMKGQSKVRILAVLWAVLCLWGTLSLCCAAGEGAGGGGGPAVPLEMDWSFPADGERNVSLHTVIQCKFSHNVAHATVQKRNKTLFSMEQADGTPVAVEVYLVDAQMEFSKRQYVYLIPKSSLAPNTTYVVHVKEGVQAKNGMATESAQSFSFTTRGTSPDTIPLMVTSPDPSQTTGQPSETEAAEETVAGQGFLGEESSSPEVSEQSKEPAGQTSSLAGIKPAEGSGTDGTDQSASLQTGGDAAASQAVDSAGFPTKEETEDTKAPSLEGTEEIGTPTPAEGKGISWWVCLPVLMVMGLILGFYTTYREKRGDGRDV